ncbi:shikimate kinase [Clostridium aminobutyricum]|uniref:Shikimate kinase n=1 Tax=Clostridium aminobutyricum TaxID=33953 RepID=A0A939DBD2_CLOAM|nr:shikimate kinase [Clostridium aminobutyricum]MBN7774487.1 shikimate kinase [Clostridium aminobutyricum]
MKEMKILEKKNNKKAQIKPLFSHSIYLIGFMGCGKSTVASYLSDLLVLDMVELDELLAEKEGLSIADIFSQYGEEYFRDQESKLIMDLEGVTQRIVSCGGGAVLREANVKSMKQNGRVVLLTASPQTIYERVKNTAERPLLNDNMSVEHISELIERRREKYERAADLVVTTDDKSIPEICQEIMDKMTELEG